MAGKSSEQVRVEIDEWPIGRDGLPMVWQRDGRKTAGGYWVERSRHREDSRRQKANRRNKDPEGVREFTRIKGMSWRIRLRNEFFAEYGTVCNGLSDGRPCPNDERNPERLTVGHLRNDGKAHRERLVSGGANNNATISVLRDLKRRGWPKDEGIAPQCGSCQLEDLRAMIRNG